jgi:hypothetical protein
MYAVRKVRLRPAQDTRRSAPELHLVTVHALPQLPPARATATDKVVDLMPAIAIGANLYITFIDLWLIVAFPNLYGHVIGRALVVAAAALPLHLRHLWFAVQGRRPPAGAWTLSALALVSLSSPRSRFLCSLSRAVRGRRLRLRLLLCLP